MTSFALVSVEKDYRVVLSEGKVTVGRGPFLKLTDKRVSRNHATLEVCDGSLTILPIHTNPTFYQACGETKFEPLEKDEVKKLQNGNCISFLPNDLIFRVEIKDDGIIEDTTAEEAHKPAEVSDTKGCNVECNSKVLEDNNVKDNNKVSNTEDTNVEINKESEGSVPTGEVLARNSKIELDDEEEDDLNDEDEMDDESDYGDEVDGDRTEIEDTAQLLNKTRVLPIWMTKDKGNEAKESSKKGKTTKKNVKKVADVTKVKVKEDLVESPAKTKEILEENEDIASGRNDDDDKSDNNKGRSEEHSDQEEDGSVETEEHVSSVIEEEDKKRKRDESEDEGQSSKREKKLPRCPYGNRCYRKNPVHFQEYSHNEGSEESEEELQDDLPECPYGEYCYRKNLRHRREYKHTPQPKTRERRAKKKAGTGKIRDDDEDGPNDYDFDDSFIDDESESNEEPSDDSDWQPSGGDDDDGDDDVGDEDVGELLTEARNFTKNKKMLKPT